MCRKYFCLFISITFLLIILSCEIDRVDISKDSITQKITVDGTTIEKSESIITLFQPTLTVDESVESTESPFYNADKSGVTVNNFAIGRYEVTYELWYAVRNWALKNGYRVLKAREGNAGVSDAAPTAENKQQPAVAVSWRNAIVWCNALSEITGRVPVFYADREYKTVLKTFSNDGETLFKNPGEIDCPYIMSDRFGNTDILKCTANGFRLPTEKEWEFAARGSRPYNTTNWNYKYAGSDTADEVSWGYDNSDNKTHIVGTKKSNLIGIYDMCGNAAEWCWDWYSDTQRAERGGSYCTNTTIDRRFYKNPAYSCTFRGFRTCFSVFE